jgi:hypothetical protein
VTVSPPPPTDEFKLNRRVRRCWYRKVLCHKVSPFDLTVFYDCDHVFVADYDYAIFDKIEDYGLFSCHNKKGFRKGRGHSRRDYKKAQVIQEHIGRIKKEVPVIWPANGGCVGSRKDSPLIDEWEDSLRLFDSKGSKKLKYVADEYSLSYTMSMNEIPMMSSKWSFVPPLVDIPKWEHPEGVLGIHFNNGRYVDSPLFQENFKEAYNDDALQFASMAPLYDLCSDFYGRMKERLGFGDAYWKYMINKTRLGVIGHLPVHKIL